MYSQENRGPEETGRWVAGGDGVVTTLSMAKLRDKLVIRDQVSLLSIFSSFLASTPLIEPMINNLYSVWMHFIDDWRR